MRTVVIGGGSAGVPVAVRLSEHPQRDVLLLEAGASGNPPLDDLLDGTHLKGLMMNPSAVWPLEVNLTSELTTQIMRGKHLGGSSAVNGGYFVRPRLTDFREWAQRGGTRWSFNEALSVLRMIERDLDFGSEPEHGDSGPIPVHRPALHGELLSAFQLAAEELGFRIEQDKNASLSTPGFGSVPSNVIDGVRVNTAMAYLEKAPFPENLSILDQTRALRLRIVGTRVVGVEVQTTAAGGQVMESMIDADEVVLCAGAVYTPQILMLSGIGPRDELARHGIPVHADLPVGIGFRDHPDVSLLWRSARSVDNESEAPFPAAINFDSSGELGRFPDGDLEILIAAQPDRALFGSEDSNDHAGQSQAQTRDTYRLIVSLQEPESRGTLTLRSADPLEQPEMNYHYLDSAADRERLRVGIRTGVGLLTSDAMSDVVHDLVDFPINSIESDQIVDDWIRANLYTAVHLCATAAMGSVVDGVGRVSGFSNLRVADTSILPSTPRRGTACAAVLTGEVVARAMLEESQSLDESGQSGRLSID